MKEIKTKNENTDEWHGTNRSREKHAQM